jgi:hypothetical protein
MDAVRLRTVLREHWLVSVGCDHDAGTDTPVCACSRVSLGTHPNVQAAVDAWVAHVLDVALKAETKAA